MIITVNSVGFYHGPNPLNIQPTHTAMYGQSTTDNPLQITDNYALYIAQVTKHWTGEKPLNPFFHAHHCQSVYGLGFFFFYVLY